MDVFWSRIDQRMVHQDRPAVGEKEKKDAPEGGNFPEAPIRV
jgi:hypothetical protein